MGSLVHLSAYVFCFHLPLHLLSQGVSYWCMAFIDIAPTAPEFYDDAPEFFDGIFGDPPEAEHDSPPPPPTITPDDIDALNVEDYAKLIKALYEEQAALRYLYHTGE